MRRVAGLIPNHAWQRCCGSCAFPATNAPAITNRNASRGGNCKLMLAEGARSRMPGMEFRILTRNRRLRAMWSTDAAAAVQLQRRTLQEVRRDLGGLDASAERLEHFDIKTQ